MEYYRNCDEMMCVHEGFVSAKETIKNLASKAVTV